MQIDVTAYWMGDPITAFRRPPTAEESDRLDRQIEERRRGPYTFNRKPRTSRGRQLPKDLRLLTLKAGEAVDYAVRSRAETGRAWMARNFMQCSVKRLADGKYWLRRVG